MVRKERGTRREPLPETLVEVVSLKNNLIHRIATVGNTICVFGIMFPEPVTSAEADAWVEKPNNDVVAKLKSLQWIKDLQRGRNGSVISTWMPTRPTRNENPSARDWKLVCERIPD